MSLQRAKIKNNFLFIPVPVHPYRLWRGVGEHFYPTHLLPAEWNSRWQTGNEALLCGERARRRVPSLPCHWELPGWHGKETGHAMCLAGPLWGLGRVQSIFPACAAGRLCGNESGCALCLAISSCGDLAKRKAPFLPGLPGGSSSTMGRRQDPFHAQLFSLISVPLISHLLAEHHRGPLSACPSSWFSTLPPFVL